MGITYKAEEVFELAEQIERNGARFYRRAAELHPDPENRDFLQNLAEMEDNHEETFIAMREQLSAAESGTAGADPDDEAEMFLRALAASHGGEGSPVETAELEGDETMEDIIRTGISLEKNTVIFYNDIIENIPAEYGQDKVEKIIEEEKSHIVTLADKLEELEE